MNPTSSSIDKPYLHFISTEAGSIWEITSDLLPYLEKEFIVTKDWKREIPLKREVLLCHFLKPEMFLEPDVFDSFQFKVLIQPIDGTHIKKEVVDMLNCFDVIFTPAEAGKMIMQNNGVGVPIMVIPNYYKDNLFEKKIWTDIESYIPKDKIIFYHESSFHPRKGIEILYEGFIRAFADSEMVEDVVLIVKDLPYTHTTFYKNEELKAQAIKLQNSFYHPPTILKFSSFLNEDELKTIWNACDAYVSLAKIEGFGIPLLRMAMLNKPIIALKNFNSGYMDFLNSSNSYLIDCYQTRASDEFMWLYTGETEWGIPLMQNVVETFRTCFHDIKKKSAKLIKATDRIKKEMSLQSVANSYIYQIKKSYSAFIKIS